MKRLEGLCDGRRAFACETLCLDRPEYRPFEIKCAVNDEDINTRSAIVASLPESANGGQIDRRVVYCLLIYIMLSGEGKYLNIIIYHHLVIYFVMFYIYDVSNRPISGNIADNE